MIENSFYDIPILHVNVSIENVFKNNQNNRTIPNFYLPLQLNPEKIMAKGQLIREISE